MLVIKNGWHYDAGSKQYVLDEQGKKIPEDVCLCYAREPTECCCGCTSWGNYHYWDEYDSNDDSGFGF